MSSRPRGSGIRGSFSSGSKSSRWSSRQCEVRVESLSPPTSSSDGRVDCTSSVVVYALEVVATLRPLVDGDPNGRSELRWTVPRRYSELRRFYAGIVRDIPATDLRQLPPFPPRRLFGTGLTKPSRDANAGRRARELLAVMQALMSLVEANALKLYQSGSVWEDPIRLALWRELSVDDNTYEAPQGVPSLDSSELYRDA